MNTAFKNSGLFTADEFKNRGVIKLAPDVLVYIGGSLQSTIIAPVAGKDTNLNFNDGITSVNIQATIDTPGGNTASIEVQTPIYNEKSNYWVPFVTEDGMQRFSVFTPMMEVKIYMKGRFMVDNQPRYYPVFWGFITGIEENFSGGVWKVTLNCSDMLHWWGMSTITVHPTPASQVAAGGGPAAGQLLTPYKTIFERATPYEIIWRMFKDMGMSDFVSPTWLVQLTPLQSFYPTKLFEKQVQGITAYWRERFAGGLGGLLKMYGLSGNPVNNKGVREYPKTADSNGTSTGNSRAKKAVQRDDLDRFDLDKAEDGLINKFMPYFDYNNMGTFQSAETMTKLDIATEVKNRINFEFFQDFNGNFIFKPPFYNINVKGIQPYEFEPHDIINCSFNVDSDQIKTVMEVSLPMDVALKSSDVPRKPGFYMDVELTQKYGVRYFQKNYDFIQNPNIARTLAMGELGTINASAYNGSITVPGRPEIRLGYPIYVRHRDSYHYVKSINHTFDYGGSCTTSMSFMGERRRAFRFVNNKWTGPQANLVWQYDAAILNKKDPSNPPDIFDLTSDQAKAQDLMEGLAPGTTRGLYKIVPNEKIKTATPEALPYSDELGYRVIGAFSYGRGVNPKFIGSDVSVPETPTENISSGAGMESARMSSLFNFKGSVAQSDEGIVPGYLGKSTNLVSGVKKDLPATESTQQGTASQPNQVSTQNGIQNKTIDPNNTATTIAPGSNSPRGKSNTKTTANIGSPQ